MVLNALLASALSAQKLCCSAYMQSFAQGGLIGVEAATAQHLEAYVSALKSIAAQCPEIEVVKQKVRWTDRLVEILLPSLTLLFTTTAHFGTLPVAGGSVLVHRAAQRSPARPERPERWRCARRDCCQRERCCHRSFEVRSGLRRAWCYCRHAFILLCHQAAIICRTRAWF